MSSTYLDKFRSKLPTVQGDQILKLLISKRDSGEIKTVDEFKEKLKELTTTILAERITPTLKLYEAILGEDISSEQYNEMLGRIEDDLEAGFAEADNLDEIIEAHHNLINNVSLKALRFGINELESKVNLYEFLNKNSFGLDDALFNTFRESLNLQTGRADKAASLVFIDPRKNQTITSAEDAQVDIVGERLILGPNQDEILGIRAAEWLSNDNSIRSEFNVEFENSSISNIIDGENNTFWIESILSEEILNTGAPMEIALHMNASQDVNYIEIEPASNFPMTLTGLDYIDSNNTRQVGETFSATINGPTRVNFGRITTKVLIVKIRQDNYKEIQFKEKPGTSNFHRAVLNQTVDVVDMDLISDDLREKLSSDFIMSDIFSLPTNDNLQRKYFEYTMGFDNIRAGFSTFDDRSIFVSSRKDVTKLGEIGLRIDEVRPVQIAGSTETSLETFTYPSRSDDEDDKFYHGVIEYWAVIQSFTNDNYLIATDTIPLLPIGAQRVYHEQLIFTDTETGAANPNMGQLMFYTEDDSTDVLVYRNGTLLTHGPDPTGDWQFIETTDDSGLTVVSPNLNKPMKRGVKINDSVRPLDIYTVSYTPTVSNTQVIPSDTTLLKITDLVGDQSARMVESNLVLFEEMRSSYIVDHTEVYLLVILRRNSAKQSFSPALEEFMLVTGSRDTSKFVGD